MSAPPLTPTSSGEQAGGGAVGVVLDVARNKTYCYPASSGSQWQQGLGIVKKTTESERKEKTVSRSNDNQYKKTYLAQMMVALFGLLVLHSLVCKVVGVNRVVMQHS